MSMKNNYTLLMAFAIVAMAVFSSCGDDKCEQEDWIGTYSLNEGQTCTDTSFTPDATLVIGAGASSTTISIAGEDWAFAECSVTDTVSGAVITLDGDKLTATLTGICTSEYTRQ